MAAAVSMNSTSADTEFKRALESLASVGNEFTSSPTSFISIYIPAGTNAQAAWGSRLKQEIGSAKNIRCRV